MIHTPDSPTHWQYPDRFLDYFGNNAALLDQVYDEIMIALDGVDGVMLPGDEGWGVRFETPADKTMFFLKFAWHKFA